MNVFREKKLEVLEEGHDIIRPLKTLPFWVSTEVYIICCLTDP